MNVLFVANIGCPPQFRTWRISRFCEYLPEFGWTPSILSVRDPQNDSRFDDKDSLPDHYARIHIHRSRKFSPFIWNIQALEKVPPRMLLQIPDKQIGWYPFAVRDGVNMVKSDNIDVIFSTSGPPTSHLIAMAISRKTGVPWIADFRDHWTTLQLHPRNIAKLVERTMERRILRNAERITVTWSGLTERLHLVHDGIPPEKFVEITHGYSPEEMSVKEAFPFEGLTICFFGVLVAPQEIDPILSALELVDEEVAAAIRFVFVGLPSPPQEAMMKQANLRYEKFTTMPHGEAMKILNGSDALLLVLKDRNDTGGHSIFRNMYPAKIFDYIGCGKPILAAVPKDSACGKLVNATKTGMVVDSADPAEIAEALTDMHTRWKSGTLTIDPDRNEIRKYERRNVTKKLATLLDEVVAEKKHRSQKESI